MSKLVSVPNLGTVEFPDDTPDEAISSSITDHLDRLSKKSDLSQQMASARRERVAGDIAEKVTGAASNAWDTLGRKAASVFEGMGRGAREEVQATSEVPGVVGDISRAIPADIAAASEPLLNPVRLNTGEQPKPFTGNINAAIVGQPLPIDAAIQLSAEEQAQRGQFPIDATVASIGQGVAATAPLAALGVAPALAQKLLLAGFTAKQVMELPGVASELGAELGKPEDQRDPNKVAQLSSALTQNIGFTALGGAGLVKSFKPKGKSNASQEPPNAAVYGNVRPLEKPAEVMPTAEGSGGIQPQASGGIPATPESAQPARPREENQVPLNEQAPPTEANAPASVPSAETAGVSEASGSKSDEAKAPVTKPLKVGEAPTPADIHAATHEEFMAYHDAMKAPGEQRAAVNEFAKSLDENGIKEAERLAQVSRDKAKEIIGGDGPLETRFKQSMEENQRTQFLAEGARTAKAMKAVEEGSTPAEAAKKLGVPVSALEPVAEAKSPEPVKPVEAANPTEQSAISERLRKQRARETEDRRVGLFQKLMTRSTDEDLRAATANISAEDKQWIKDRLDAAPGDAPRIRQALGIAAKEEPVPLSKPVKANVKKAPASKQAELTFEEQKAEQAELNKAHDEPRSYTSATEDESGRLYLNPVGPLIRTTLSDIRDFSHGVKKSAEWIIEKGREAAGLTKEAAKEGFNVGGKMNDYRRSVLNWSMKLQKSFGEAAHAQRDIQKRVPDSIRREAITNWIQADGDNTILANRAATTTDKRLKKGYEIAQKLTPDELAIAKQIKGVYDALGQRGQAYGVINNFKENYVTQIWNLKNRLGGSARTLKDKFKYAKARTFDSFYDGEQAGYDPKTKDISKLLPSYLHEMNSVIAARQLVKQMQNGVAADGRPLLVPRGTGTPVSGPSGDATLITPKAVKGDTSDYKLLPNQPALNDWVWAAKDQAGNNIFLKADLMVHPKVYDKLKNTLGRSAIQEWYKSDTGALAMVPKRAVELIDRANAETKRTMLGLITPFHQVQEGTHAVGHRVNPFSVPEIDLVGKPEQADAAKHGLMLLPDRASESQFMDGFKTTGLLSHVPGLGRATDAYSRYLFHDYIPGLKMKTYEAILERNKSVFAKDLASGAVSLEDVKVTSAEQTNAAYGHLNYADLGRNPTISHIARALLLAPDFFEARARFAGQAAKGAIGTKVGREQILALGFLALAQATGAYTFAKLSGGEWDKKHPFEFTRQGKRYTMRSVPEDISSLIKDPRMYFNNRMSPAASTADQLRTGLDWKGDRISAGDTLKEAVQKPIPLSVRAMLKMGSKNLTALEQLAGSIGLKISSANPKMEKGIEIKDRTELLANKLRKLNRIERYKSAKDELKDLPPKDRNTVIDKLRRQGVFTYQ